MVTLLSSKRFLILSILALIPIVQTNPELFNGDFEDYFDGVNPGFNESLTIITPTNTTKPSLKPVSASKILKALSTTYVSSTKINKNHTSTNSVTKQSTSSPQSTTTRRGKAFTTTPSRTIYMIVSDLVNNLNHYRNMDILSHIKQCDTHLKLEEMCEIYSFDNHTYSLIRERERDFQSLQSIYELLVDSLVVEKLNNFCPTGQWCLGNLSKNEIHYTTTVLKQRGRSFCFLEKCHHRLLMHSNTCPSIISKNISIPTLKLMPMLCTLHREQQSWNTTKCQEQLVYLLHYLYAFWPRLETCYNVITAASSGACTVECFAFESLLHQTDSQCNKDASFLTRVPILAWYRSINLRQVCNPESIPTHAPFISSMKNFISTNVLWYQLHQKPVYAVLFVILIICIVSGFSLCLCLMSKNDYESNTRHLDDDYEYTRLHDSTFELGANTEISNNDVTSSRMINQSETDFNRNNRSAEHQRLLHMGM